jgi:hypothetical protein
MVASAAPCLAVRATISRVDSETDRKDLGVEQATIKINASFVWLIQFLLYFFKPVISIDDGEQKKIRWGESEYSVSPGRHTINIAISYFFGWNVSKGSAIIDVGANQTVTLRYRAPLFANWNANLREV